MHERYFPSPKVSRKSSSRSRTAPASSRWKGHSRLQERRFRLNPQVSRLGVADEPNSGLLRHPVSFCMIVPTPSISRFGYAKFVFFEMLILYQFCIFMESKFWIINQNFKFWQSWCLHFHQNLFQIFSGSIYIFSSHLAKLKILFAKFEFSLNTFGEGITLASKNFFLCWFRNKNKN